MLRNISVLLLLTLVTFPHYALSQQRDYGIKGEATIAVDIAHVPTMLGVKTFKFEATSKYV